MASDKGLHPWLCHIPQTANLLQLYAVTSDDQSGGEDSAGLDAHRGEKHACPLHSEGGPQ